MTETTVLFFIHPSTLIEQRQIKKLKLYSHRAAIIIVDNTI